MISPCSVKSDAFVVNKKSHLLRCLK